MVDGRGCFGNLRWRQIDKILSDMGLYGSIWVDIEGIRSHGCYKGSDIAKWDLVCYIIFYFGSNVGLETFDQTNRKICMLQRSPKGIKILVGPVGVF